MADGYAYSVKQLAEAWDVSTSHIYTLCNTHQLGHLRLGKSIIRIRQADREAFEARQWQAPKPVPHTEIPPAGEVVPMATRGQPAVHRDWFRLGQQNAAKMKKR
jgi:hypothetical protein